MLKFFQGKSIRFSGWALFILSGILLFIYTLPHIIALKKLLIFIGFLLSAKIFLYALRQKQYGLIGITSALGILQIWMLLVSLLFASNPLLSLSEWKGQWLPTILSFIIGVALAFTIMRARFSNPVSIVALIIFVPITAFVILNDLIVIYHIISTRSFITHDLGLTDHYANIGYLVALLEAILIADMLNRAIKRGPLLPIPAWATGLVLTLGIFALVTAAARNGILIMLLAFVLAAALMLAELKRIYPLKKVSVFLLVTCIFISGYVLVSFKTDPRWKNFSETVPIAWNIDRDNSWLNADETNLPLTPSGIRVEPSAYYRIAWAHEGFRMLVEHPWGLEISRSTFHDLEMAKYGHAGMSHSHNSWIDFGLNVGLAGLLLWATFLFLLVRKGWSAWKSHKAPLGLALIILVIMFAIRGLLDSIFRDHIIGQFMLVAGLLVGALSFQQGNKANVSTK
jgi:O-Antigen ligase